MRMLKWFGLVVLVSLLGAPGVTADDGRSGDGAAQSAAKVAEAALSTLKVRMDARIKEGELLAKSGRLEEALDAYRSVGDLYKQGMAEVRELLASLGSARQPAAAAIPLEPPVGIGGSAGGAFRGRGGTPQKTVRPKAAAAVERGLAWLAAHQSPNGGWEAAGFHEWCNGKPIIDLRKQADGRGKRIYDVGVTGTALLAFLGSGYTSRGKHPYAQVVKRGVRYLKNVQDPEGCFGPRATAQYIYNHAIASLAMIEAFGMTNSPLLKTSAQRALDFIAVSRNPYFAWRYGIKPGDNDTSVTAWMVMCLKSATLINRDALKRGNKAPLTLDEEGFKGARAWPDKVTDPDYGRVGYVQRGTGPARPQELMNRFPNDKSEAMTAAGILMRIFTGEDPRKSGIIKKGVKLCRGLPPVWNVADGSIDMMYWYFGTLAMFQVGGRDWAHWSKHLDSAMVETQRLEGDRCTMKGSWDPVGPWGRDGGRVYSTALMIMCLQVQSRYARVFGMK